MPKNLELEKPAVSDSESAEEDASSSEEGDSSDSGSESETEEVQTAKLPSVTPKKSQPESSVKAPQIQESSSDDDGSETESGEPNSKPIASKPFANPPKPSGGKNPKSNLTASDAVTPVKSTGAKRLAEDKGSQAKDAKKLKKQQPETEPGTEVATSEKKSNDDSKKQLFQRLWSEDDEIVILKGMMEFSEKNKSDPVADLDAFHDFIKRDLHIEVANNQLLNKIRRLKKKFENNKSKEKDGKDRVFSKPHEHKAYELSKQVWGNMKIKERRKGEKSLGSPKGKGKSARKSQKNIEVENVESGDEMDVEAAEGSGDKAVTFHNTMEGILRSGAELFKGSGKAEQEREWRKLKINEMEVYLKKLDLMRAQTKLVLDVLKSDH